jgi:hypothetical protein
MSDVEHLVHDDGLAQVRPGVLAPVDPAGRFGDERRSLVLARVAAAERSVTTPHWWSQETAAVLLGLWTYHVSDRVDLIQLHPPHVERDDGWRHRYRVSRHWTHLPARDRTVVRGVPVTTLERTAVDCARTLPFHRALVVMDCALRHGADVALVNEILDESKGKRGVVQARRVVELGDPGSESPGESLVRARLIEAMLPPPQTQVRVETSDGEKWLDLGWPEVQVGVEFDGDVKYTELANGEPERVLADQARRQDAVEATGWWLERSGWSDIEDPGRFTTRVQRAWSRHGRPTAR